MRSRSVSRWISSSILCFGCLGFLCWVYVFSSIAIASYQTTDLPSGTYCVGACPGNTQSVSGSGINILFIGLFQLTFTIFMLAEFFKQDFSSMMTGFWVNLGLV